MRTIFDVDIDVSPVTDRGAYGVRAMAYNENAFTIQPHPSGVYLDPVPIDKMTGGCAFDYKYGDEVGFMKADLLNNSVYGCFSSKDEVLKAVNGDVDWSLLQRESVCSKLPHIGKHFDLVRLIKPVSIIELADVIALIRPAKVKYIDDYLADPEYIRKYVLYKKPLDGQMYFKKSHAVSYAMMIVCALSKQTVSGTIVWY